MYIPEVMSALYFEMKIIWKRNNTEQVGFTGQLLQLM